MSGGGTLLADVWLATEIHSDDDDDDIPDDPEIVLAQLLLGGAGGEIRAAALQATGRSVPKKNSREKVGSPTKSLGLSQRA